MFSFTDTFASGKSGAETEHNWQEFYNVYMDKDIIIDEEDTIIVLSLYKKDNNDKDSYHTLISSYLRGNEDLRSIIEKVLDKDNKPIISAKQILRGVRKAIYDINYDITI